MNFLEKNLEQIIYECNKDTLSERGLYLYGNLLRQVQIGSYGIADLIEYQRPSFNPYLKTIEKGYIRVLELKKDEINAGTLLQAIKYLKGIERFLSIKFDISIHDYFNCEISLIGSKIDKSSGFIFLTDFMTHGTDYIKEIGIENGLNLSIYQYKYEIDGLYFKQISGYKNTRENFYFKRTRGAY